ncbi:MAG: hypothetical protein RL150_200 [Candidatus Parcubacteria bacterium]|jgi:drug/metabolite transporter (DMT)-like permease
MNLSLPILLSLIASVLYGLSGPFAKIGYNRSMHSDGFVLPYGVGLLIFSLLTITKKGIGTMYPNSTAWFWGIVAGGMCAIGFKMSSSALATPGANVSVLQILIGTFPIVSVAVALPLFREWENLVLWKLLLGALLVFLGAALVTTSTKPAL